MTAVVTFWGDTVLDSITFYFKNVTQTNMSGDHNDMVGSLRSVLNGWTTNAVVVLSSATGSVIVATREINNIITTFPYYG